MTTPDDLLDRARRLQTEPVEQIVTESYPAVVRMARGLVGNEAAARRVVDTVIGNSLRVLPTWRAGAVPSNWFYHHTLLAARSARSRVAAGDVRGDLLVAAAAVKDAAPNAAENPAYLAFIRALRSLPPQQMEAYLLHHGERLNTRLLGVAMDCSTSAATNHLAAATAAMDAVAGESAAELARRLDRAYWSLGPAAAAAIPNIRGTVRRMRWSRRIHAAVRRVILLAVLAGAAWAVWHFRATELQWISMLRQQLSPTPPAAPPTAPAAAPAAGPSATPASPPVNPSATRP